MGFFTILLILFLIFIVWPVVRTSIRIRSVMRDMTDRARQAAGSGFRNPSSAGQKRKRKKIDPNVGEFVEFVEISTVRDELNTDNSGNTSKFRTEQQIVDAEWVDIPDKK